MGIMSQKELEKVNDGDVGTIRPWKKSMRETVEGAVGDFLGGDYWANKTAKNLTGLADFVPVVGDAAGAMDTVDSLNKEDYVGAGIDGFATLLGVTPLVGPALSKSVKGLKQPIKKALGARPNPNVANELSEKAIDKTRLTVNQQTKILEDHGYRQWDGEGSKAETFDLKNDKIEVYTGYTKDSDVGDGTFTRGVTTNVLSPAATTRSLKKILGYDVGPTIKTVDQGEIGVNVDLITGQFLKQYGEEVLDTLEHLAVKATAGTTEANKLLQVPVSEGTKVGIRLNLNSNIPDAPPGINKLQTLHKNNFNGKVLSYVPHATVENVVFSVSPKGRQGIAAKINGVDVPEAKNKFPAMSVDGNLAQAKNVVRKGGRGVKEIGFNPKNNHLFIDMETGQAVKGAKVATVVGDRVYARGVTYWKKSEAPTVMDASDGTELPSEVRYKFNQGGLVDDEMEALNLSTPNDYTLSGGLPKEVAPEEGDDRAALEAAIIEMRRKEAAGEEYSSYTPPVEEATTFYDKDDQDFLEYRAPVVAPEEPLVATPSPTIAEAPTVPTVAPVEPVAYVYTDARGTDNTRGVRNNNPLNIEQGSNAWDGLATDQSADERFAVFDDAEHGIRAAIRTLVTYQVKHDLQTPSAMITRWAPPWKTDRLGNFLLDAAGNKIQENDTAAYISTVARVSGLDANSSLVIGDNIETKELIKGMILMENGGDAMRGYSDETYNKALELAFPERIEVGADDRQAYVDLTDWDNAIV